MRYSFSVFHHDDREHPWITTSHERHIVALPGDVDFQEWAQARWPPPDHRVELDPGQPSRT